MFTSQLSRQSVQQAVCLLLSAVIVSSALTLGYVGAQIAERDAIAAFIEARA